jgi:transcriptional regulator with PAS, ATPase and Fis domain
VSDNIRKCIELGKKASQAGVDTLILGETGTGKELFAQAIHNYINPDRPFVGVSSPAIPFELAESELFGYAKGAFSGAAVNGKKGKFEIANNGTLFLDEISSLPLSIQSKILRALEQREIQTLGDSRTKKLNFHLISASNEDLIKLAKEGKFRSDLYFRLAKITIKIDPLRERKEDIPIIVKHLLKQINRRHKTNYKGMSKEVQFCFMNYHWPGNVREVINVLEQAILSRLNGKMITLKNLPEEIIKPVSAKKPPKSDNIRNIQEHIEKESILQALNKTEGNKRKAALFIGMPRRTFYRRLKKFKLDV